MTKTCPNCGNENKSTSKFCESCGAALDDAQIKSKGNMDSINRMWNKQGTGVKAIIGGVGVCCLGLIILLVIGAMVSPDVNTSNTTNQSSVNITPNTTFVNNSGSNTLNTSETPKDFWATNYPKLTDTCPNCGKKARLDEKTDKIYTFYCPNCDAYYGVNLDGSDKDRIGFDPQDGVSPLKYFPRK